MSPAYKAGYEAVRTIISQSLGHHWSGQFDSAGTAFYAYFRDVCDLQLGAGVWERFGAYERTVRSAGWWYPHRRFVMACDRPAELHFEGSPAGNRLHHNTGPAITWRDGYALHFIHGTRVPGWIVEHTGRS